MGIGIERTFYNGGGDGSRTHVRRNIRVKHYMFSYQELHRYTLDNRAYISMKVYVIQAQYPTLKAMVLVLSD